MNDTEKKQNIINWTIFIVISLIWGSSFKLMKIGMIDLTSYQVSALRLFSAGLVFSVIGIREIKKLENKKIIPLIVISSLLGNFLPAFLLCLAETKIDSSLAGIINSLMPVFVIITGKLFFDLHVKSKKWLGIAIAFIALSLLLFSKVKTDFNNLPYSLYVVCASLFYGINSNIIIKYLKDFKAVQILSIGLSILAIPSFLILVFTGYFNKLSLEPNFIISTSASLFLGVIGTALAFSLFYYLIKSTGSVFSATVTYTMPVVAICWGLLSGEHLTAFQLACFSGILGGVYLTSK